MFSGDLINSEGNPCKPFGTPLKPMTIWNTLGLCGLNAKSRSLW
jgi:hypothetical protein